MLAVPDADTTRLDPFFAQAHRQRHRQHRRSGHRQGVHARSAAHRAEGRGLSEADRHRRHVLHRPRAGILHLRRGPLRAEPAPRATTRSIRSRAPGTPARIEEPNLGYKPSFKGGYFPVSPTDTYHDLRGEMVYEMRKIGIVVEAHHHEVATAGQSEIDMQFQPLLKMADQFMWDKLHLQERREAPRQDRDVHAEADLRRQRQRHAHAHRRSGRAASRCLPATATPGSARWVSTPRAACSNTRRPSSRSPRRRPIPTGAWCPASKRRSTSRCRRATARRRSASRCTRRARKPSGSSSAAPIRAATATSPGRRC